jgi:hypothetical protein
MNLGLRSFCVIVTSLSLISSNISQNGVNFNCLTNQTAIEEEVSRKTSAKDLISPKTNSRKQNPCQRKDAFGSY